MYWPALSAAKHIVIDAEALRNDFGRALRNKAQYIAYQAPEPEIKALNISTRERLNIEKKYFLVIARLEPENNIGMIIKAFKEMSQSDVDLLIVGGTSTKYYTEVLQFEGGDNVRFLGSIYEQPILNELRGDCLAYVHGHSVGGTNPSLLEALASCGGALLCHDNQYNREVAGLEAQYFESVQKLSEQMTALTVPSRSSLRRIPTRDSRFKPETIAQQYLKLFEVIRAAG
jgi:rhamnosyltransferase